MEGFCRWVLEHNPGGRRRYLLSLAGVAGYFVLFTLSVGRLPRPAMGLLALFVFLMSWEAGRYCLNRFLYIREPEMLRERQAVSSVVRFHAFDVDEYFAGLRTRLYVPVSVIFFCVMLSVGAAFLDGENCVCRVAVALAAGGVSAGMVHVAFWMKKRQTAWELQHPADSAGGTWLAVCGTIIAGIELVGFFIGLLWVLSIYGNFCIII